MRWLVNAYYVSRFNTNNDYIMCNAIKINAVYYLLSTIIYILMQKSMHEYLNILNSM